MKKILFILVSLYFTFYSNAFSQWNDISDPSYESPYCIEWADSLNGWIGRDDTALRTTDGGSTWYTFEDAPTSIIDFYFLNSNAGWYLPD